MTNRQHPGPRPSLHDDPALVARMVRLTTRYSPRRFGIVQPLEPYSCDSCGSDLPPDADVLVTGLEMQQGKVTLLDAEHEPIGEYPSPAAALQAYAQDRGWQPGTLEIIWADEPYASRGRLISTEADKGGGHAET